MTEKETRLARERNLLVSILSKHYQCHLSVPVPGTESKQFPHIVCLHLPCGVASYHATDEEAKGIFRRLKFEPNDWDGVETRQQRDKRIVNWVMK